MEVILKKEFWMVICLVSISSCWNPSPMSFSMFSCLFSTLCFLKSFNLWVRPLFSRILIPLWPFSKYSSESCNLWNLVPFSMCFDTTAIPSSWFPLIFNLKKRKSLLFLLFHSSSIRLKNKSCLWNSLRFLLNLKWLDYLGKNNNLVNCCISSRFIMKGP